LSARAAAAPAAVPSRADDDEVQLALRPRDL